MMTDALGLPVPDLLTPQVRQAYAAMEGCTTPQLHDHWRDHFMPILMTFVLPDDTALRAVIRGEPVEPSRDGVRHVVVQGANEADRVATAWFQSRYASKQSMGGVARCRL